MSSGPIACNVFTRKSPVLTKAYANLPSYVLKAIAATKTDGPEIEAIRTACDEAKIEYYSPGVVGETVMHFTFPKHKTALLIRSHGAGKAPREKISRCENMGWSVTTVHISALRNLTRESIIAQFKEYIASLKTSRK